VPIDPKEQVTALMLKKNAMQGQFIVMATSKGIVKKSSLEKFKNLRSSGLIAMKLSEDEELIGACVVNEGDRVMLITRNGMAIKFNINDLRVASRTSGGVRGIRLGMSDRLIGMGKVLSNTHVLTVTENGFGKLSRLDSYPVQARGGKGLLAHRVNEKTGVVIAGTIVPAEQHLIIITAKGIVIRISIDDEVPIQGRATQGVHLNRLEEDDRVTSSAFLNEPVLEEEGKAQAE
jgi:DNA gyrase subunit A